jgi:hypothetical protein
VHHLIFAAALSLGVQAAEPASDFAFRLENKSCRYERIDSFDGTVSVLRAEPIPMTLSDPQRRAIFQAVTAWSFFDLYIPPPPPSGNTVGVWDLLVQHDRRTHRVTADLASEQARPLAMLVETISDVVRRTSPEIERLFRGGGCVEKGA